MIQIQEKKNEAAEVILILAELYKPPIKEFWEEFSNENFIHKLQDSAIKLYGKPVFASILELLPESYAEYSHIYKKNFNLTGNQAALPVESLYKQWTFDGTCTLPFAKNNGYLMGDPALHILFLLEQFQFDLTEEYRGMPDHLSILLEMLAFFMAHAPKGFTAQFIADHFDWLEDFERSLSASAGDSFYTRLTRSLIEILDGQQAEYIGRPSMKGGAAFG